MSIFKDSGIIIKINKLNQKEFLYTIFSNNYWKIVTQKKFSKKEKSLDLWYYINFEIETPKNSNVNKIRSISILSEFSNRNKSFSEINNYLILLNTIFRKTAIWVENKELIEIAKIMNKYNKNDLEIKLILANLKAIDVLWELDIQNKNITISKILNFINKNKIQNILKLSWISSDIKKELQSLL